MISKLLKSSSVRTGKIRYTCMQDYSYSALDHTILMYVFAYMHMYIMSYGITYYYDIIVLKIVTIAS